MKILISEQQFSIITEQNTLLTILNSTTLISNLILLIRIATRGLNAISETPIGQKNLDKIQSLLKQSLAGGKTNLTESQMNKIKEQQKIILNVVAKDMGFKNWSELKEIKIKEFNKKLKKHS